MLKSLTAPRGLRLPAATAAASLASFGYALLAAREGLGGGMGALPFVLLGFLLGVASLPLLFRGWQRDRGADRPRRAAWMGLAAVRLSPFLLLAPMVMISLLSLLVYGS